MMIINYNLVNCLCILLTVNCSLISSSNLTKESTVLQSPFYQKSFHQNRDNQLIKLSRLRQQLVVISFDGFRHDYIDTFNTPNLKSMAINGVHALRGYYPAFVTKTFPTHWTLATGLHEETHGLIDNRFYDSQFNETFTRSKVDHKWFGGEPIWSTCRRQNCSANVLFWPGSASVNQSNGNHFSLPYNETISLSDRFDYLIEWINSGVDLTMIYFHQPDQVGHEFGVASEPVRSQVEIIDSMVGNLMITLRNSSRYSNVNVIITGDHGMVNLTSNGTIYLNDYINLTDISVISQLGPVASLLPKPGKFEVIYELLKTSGNPNFTVYLRKDIPSRFYYKNSLRIMPIVIFAHEGYTIDSAPRVRRRRKVAFHGYDNLLPSMRPIFFAEGPEFRRNYQVEPFNSVNLYSLFCHILRIQPAPNNGTLSSISHMLSKSSQLYQNLEDEKEQKGKIYD